MRFYNSHAGVAFHFWFTRKILIQLTHSNPTVTGFNGWWVYDSWVGLCRLENFFVLNFLCCHNCVGVVKPQLGFLFSQSRKFRKSRNFPNLGKPTTLWQRRTIDTTFRNECFRSIKSGVITKADGAPWCYKRNVVSMLKIVKIRS